MEFAFSNQTKPSPCPAPPPSTWNTYRSALERHRVMSTTSSQTTLPSDNTDSYTPHEKEETATPPQHHDEENLPPVSAEDAEVEKEQREGDPFLVKFDPDDKANPKNWTVNFRSWCTFQLGMLALSASLGSSIISPAEAQIVAYTGISDEVSVLAISLYILG